jgi:hypothetical protein
MAQEWFGTTRPGIIGHSEEKFPLTPLSPLPSIHIVALFRIIEVLLAIWSSDSPVQHTLQGASRLIRGVKRKPLHGVQSSARSRLR